MVALGETILDQVSANTSACRDRCGRCVETPSGPGTTPLASNLYQGMSQDPVTGLYYERARWYSPSLGTWISQDPAGYINGADTYQFVGSDPVGAVDSSGFALGFGTNNFMPNMGTFDVKVWSGSSYGPFSSHLKVEFHPGKRAVRDCDTIRAIQFVTTANFYDVLVSVGGGWHLDNGESTYGKAIYGVGGYPFYAGADIWTYKNKVFPLVSVDEPGESVPWYHRNWGFEQKFKLYAVVTAGRDKGKSLGYAGWGQKIYWGAPWFTTSPSSTAVKRWVVGGGSWSGTAAQNGGVNNTGLTPLPGQISW